LHVKRKSENDVQRDDHIKDLGVTFDEKLDFGLHVTEKVNKAYSMLWLIKTNFKKIGAKASVFCDTIQAPNKITPGVQQFSMVAT